MENSHWKGSVDMYYRLRGDDDDDDDDNDDDDDCNEHARRKNSKLDVCLLTMEIYEKITRQEVKQT